MSSFNNYDFQSVSNGVNSQNNNGRSECLQDIDKPTQLHQYYHEESVYNRPPIYVCRDKLEKMNNHILHHMTDSRPVCASNDTQLMTNSNNFNNNTNTENFNNSSNNSNNSDNNCQECIELPFNVRNQHSCGSYLHEGYSEGIDVDSHLKGINTYQDSCFNDQYKINPKTTSCKESRLPFYANVLVQDYDKPSKETIRNAHSRNYIASSKCLQNEDFKKFDPCPNENNDVGQNKSPVEYRFTNDTFCKDWPCQKLFYNSTRRSTINSFTNTHSGKDINPKNVYCKPPYQHPMRCDGSPNPLYKRS